MKKSFSRIIVMAITFTLLFSQSFTAFAALSKKELRNLPETESWSISVKDKKLTLSSSISTPKTYNLYDSNISFYVDTNGLVLSYQSGKNDVYKTVTLGKNIKEFDLSGSFNRLAFTDTVDYRYTANIDASINDFTVSGGMKVVFSDNSSINRMGIYSKDAQVFTGSAKVFESNKLTATQTRLDVKIRDYSTYSTGTAYDEGTKTLYLNAKAAETTVKQAVSDVILSIQRTDEFSSVYGTWIWPNINGSSTESGRYTYHFIPHDNNYQSQTLYIEFKAAE